MPPNASQPPASLTADETASAAADPADVVFGDLRPRVGCEYVVDVLPFAGGAVVGAGSHSVGKLDLVPLTCTGRGQWSFAMEETLSLAGAHGEEIVRTMYVDDQVSTWERKVAMGVIHEWRC